MSFQEMAMHLWPMWAMGIFMMVTVFRSEHRDLLKVSTKPILKWIGYLGVITAIRLFSFWMIKQSGTDTSIVIEKLSPVNTIPWQGIFGVFWEDAMHGLPLALLARGLPSKWWSKLTSWAATVLIMLSFGSGHMYQGLLSAFLIMWYIPFSVKVGQKHGFGTVMICHILYDLATIFCVKWALGNLL